MHTVDNKLVITTEPKTFCFGLPKDPEHTELLAEHTMKTEIRQLLSKYKHGNNIREHQKTVKRVSHTNSFITYHKD